MIAIGVDPGLHETAWAVVEVTAPQILEAGCYDLGGRLQVLDVGLWRGGQGLHEEAAVHSMIQSIDVDEATIGLRADAHYRLVVESQQVYEGAKRKGKPEDLIRLATISGAVLGAFPFTEHVVRINPTPRVWKGNVEKVVPQARACLRLGWSFKTAGGASEKKQWAVPAPKHLLSHWHGFKDGDWKNIMDAIAMAIWGLKQ